MPRYPVLLKKTTPAALALSTGSHKSAPTITSLPRGSSTVAARQAFPGWSAYVAAKHGLLGFTGAIREELRPRGIRVTAVLPAATDTALWDALPGEWDRANMLRPEDVAGAIAQLASQPAYMATEEIVVGHVAGRL